MRITGFHWLEAFVEKLAAEHGVAPKEAEEAIVNAPRLFFAETGRYQGEDVYLALGQTDGGSHLAVFFVHKAASGSSSSVPAT